MSFFKHIRPYLPFYVIVFLAVFLFFYNLGYPPKLSFDESYHIPSAQRYLSHQYFQENHPPTGKLLIALGEFMLRDDPNRTAYLDFDKVEADIQPGSLWGYRIFPALAGVGSIVLFYLVISRLVRNRLLRYSLTLLILLDNAFLVQARTAMLDSFLIFFILLSLYLSLLIQGKRSYLWLLLGISSALSITVKHTGLIVMLFWFVPVVRFLRDEGWRRTVSMLILAALAMFFSYLFIWKIHYAVAREIRDDNYYEATPEFREILDGKKVNFWERTYYEIREEIMYTRMYNRGVPELNLCLPEELGSHWYQWPFGGRSINYRWEWAGDGLYRYQQLVGNPVTWAISLIGVFLGTAVAINSMVLRNQTQNWKINLFTILYWSYLLPFGLIKRVMYLYHYLPDLFFGLILFGLVIDWNWNNSTKKVLGKRTLILIFITVGALCGFWFYRPLTYSQPLSHKQFLERAIVPSFDLRLP